MAALPCPVRVGPIACRVGRLLRALLGLGLLLSGLFALVLAAAGRFLPHDEHYLGMTARDLCALHGCRIVHFMIHDRASFGGVLTAVGIIYLWLAESPLRRREPWAWRALAVGGTVGFVSFLAYLGFGYFDGWHAAGTLTLLPCFILGLALSGARPGVGGRPSYVAVAPPLLSAYGVGRACLLACAAGLAAGGLVILVVGTTCVFVPQDLQFMGVGVDELRALNPRLVPLIAHDRAGFGGAVCCFGVTLFYVVRHGRPSRSLWCVLAAAGAVGFAAVLGVHAAVGYTDIVHLARAAAAAGLYLTGLLFTMCRMTFAHPGSGTCQTPDHAF